MHLIGFHRVLIAAAIAFFAGYGAWELAAFARGGGTLHLLLAAGSGLATGLLIVYLLRLRRILRLPGD